MNYNEKYHCRVCGFLNELPPWGEDGDFPDYSFCPCCGVEAGYQDAKIVSIRRYREKWLERGALWFDFKKEPKHWDKQQQFKNIPKLFL